MPNKSLRVFFEKLDAQGLKVTFDDVRLKTHFSTILPSDTDLRTRFSRRIALNMPIASSPMDTVTAADMAIVMAHMGGIGIVHRGLSPELQAKEVGRVKHRMHGQVFKPITVESDQSVESVLELRRKKDLKFHTFPVVDASGKMVGLLTGNDFDFCVDPSVPVREIMTPFSLLLTARAGTDREEAYRLMTRHKKKVLPLISEQDQLTGLYVFSDLRRILSGENTPYSLDAHGRLIVGAAVGVGDDALRRADLLAVESCDVFQIDTAHGDSAKVHETIHALKAHHPEVDVVAGNVSTGDAAQRLVDAGADGVMVGQGPGSICTTRVIAGIGAPQVSAVYECAAAIEGSDVPICADGGISSSGDCVVAFGVGASVVMLGRLLAGTDETPGEVETIGDKPVKVYRGMGSLGAMRDNASSRERYGQGPDPAKSVPEGVESVVPYRGSVRPVLEQLVGGIRSGMGYHGTRTLPELVQAAEIFRMTPSGLRESHPHDVQMHVTPPNYRR